MFKTHNFRVWDALSMSYTYDPGRTEGLRLMTQGLASEKVTV